MSENAMVAAVIGFVTLIYAIYRTHVRARRAEHELHDFQSQIDESTNHVLDAQHYMAFHNVWNEHRDNFANQLMNVNNEKGMTTMATEQKVFGINLTSLSDHSTSRMFADAMKTRRSFAPASTGPWGGGDSIPVDENGWPLSDFATLIMIDQAIKVDETTTVEPLKGQVHKFSCVGKIGAIKPVAANMTISNLKYDQAANKTTADFVVNGGGTMCIDVTGTEGGVKDIKCIRPGHTENDLFNKDFLAGLAPFNSIRLMDALKTNNNIIKSWAERPLPQHDQSSDKGMALEYAIELANQSGKDVWFCIPHQVDTSAYAEELAKLCKAKLKPHLKIYLEYSNEIWNFQFGQTKWAHDIKAKEDVALGIGNLNFDGSTNPGFLLWRRTAYQAVLISKAFAKIYGQAAINNQVRVILAMQYAYGTPETNNEFYQYKQALGYIKSVHGEPSQYVYATSGAPYFGAAKELLTDPLVTVDQLVTSMAERATGSAAKLARLTAYAKTFGLKNINYEGGVDLQQHDIAVAVKSAANRDPRMAQVIYNYCKTMLDNSDGHFYFAHVSRDGKYGYWGLAQDLSLLETAPKYLGVKKIAADYGIVTTQPTEPVPTTPPQTAALEARLKALEDWQTTTRDNLVALAKNGLELKSRTDAQASALTATNQAFEAVRAAQENVTRVQAEQSALLTAIKTRVDNVVNALRGLT